MTNKIKTPHEKTSERYDRIVSRYKALRKINPKASHNATCVHIAGEQEPPQTAQNIDRIIRITGNYTPRTKKK